MSYDDSILGQSTWSVLNSFIKEQDLDKWAKHFAASAHVYIQCLDPQGVPLTDLVGDPEEKETIIQLVDEDQIQDMIVRMSGSSLEDQSVESTAYPNVRVAVVVTKASNKPVVYWLVCGVLNDIGDDPDYINPAVTGMRFTLSEDQFYSVTDALRDLTNAMFENRFKIVTAQAESRRVRSSEEVLSTNLRRAEALTDIVQLLEAEGPIEKTMIRMLEIIGRFLDIELNSIIRVKKGTDEVEVLAHFSAKVTVDYNVNPGALKVNSFLTSDKPIVISSNSAVNNIERANMETLGLKALIVIPIVIANSPGMYASFSEKTNDRVWTVEEIKFINDSVKILQSILVKRVQKNSLASSFASIETILDNVGSAVYVRREENMEMLWSNSIMNTTFAKEIEDGSINDFLSKGITLASGASEIKNEDTGKYYDLYYTHIKWVDGSPVLLCALYDVTEKKIYQKKIEQQAYTDFLTGLYNRMCCERDLAKIIDGAERSGKPGALLYLDLDDFKHINDGLGHQYGDVLLKAISHSFQRVEGIEDTCYRMGGDEFVIIIPPEQYDNCNHIIAAIKDIFAKPWYLKDADYYCTMSMGVVEYPQYGTGVHELIKKADIAMYEAKKSGKNRVSYYSEGAESLSGKRLDMEKNMRDATLSGFKEFEVYFQPIVDISKPGSPCTGAEALVRWNSAELGFISPADFIPLAEYLGLINPIGNYVLYDACNVLRSWNDNGYPGYRINVNLSVVQLLQTDIVEIVENTINETGINPHNLTLEVTESLAINDMERMKKILAKIKALGVRIALDDFGTGYSSLNHIREIPFDVIKVDQSFIKDMVDKDSYASSFIKMVGELAEAIDVYLCVEGVETKEQLDILKDLPVDLIQGYYFDKPMPQSEFERKYLPLMHR